MIGSVFEPMYQFTLSFSLLIYTMGLITRGPDSHTGLRSSQTVRKVKVFASSQAQGLYKVCIVNKGC